MAHAERERSRRLRRLHRPLDPRATREIRQPHALAVRAAVKIAAKPMLQEERVEVEEQTRHAATH